MENYNKIFINGEPFNCYTFMSLQEILLYLGFKLDNIIVEHNQRILRHNQFDTVFLDDLDKIEVISVTGGG
uniref:Thiamin biosynthesis protein S n=1 Tax=Anotrichium furcellatum TaxID=41999 RepID=A0A4D6WKQ0_9FLOR|nr:Thiamin biosynthesis protein S [Anotrichium furcellatum]